MKQDFFSNKNEPPDLPKPPFKPKKSGHLKIAAFSNIHYMSPSLVKNHADVFETFLTARTHKALLDYSEDVFKQFISELINVDMPDILFIPGDLTKDGETINHQFVSDVLHTLQNDHNIKVYVLPGSCDVNSKFSKEYDVKYTPLYENGKFIKFEIESVENDVPKVTDVNTFFSKFYGDFGYNNADSHDSVSYSYMVKHHPSVWILAIEAVDYSTTKDNAGTMRRQGIIQNETMIWIEERLKEAKDNNAIVLGLMHHNATEHAPMQAKGLPNTVINSLDLQGNLVGWEATADRLAKAGLKILFTGSTHANDITLHKGELYDIDTGSLIAPFSPYRIADLYIYEEEYKIYVSTKHITSINTPTLQDDPFFKEFSKNRLAECVDRTLRQKFAPELGQALSQKAMVCYRDAFIVHILGNEFLSDVKSTADNLQLLGELPNNVYSEILGMLTDYDPNDDNIEIKIPRPVLLQQDDLIGTF